MRWEFPHRVEYEADARSIDDVIATLTAQKRLLEQGAALFCGVAGIELERVEIRVVEVSEGSLFEELVIQVYGTYQTQIEDHVIGRIETMLGVDVPSEWEPIVALGSLAVTYWVARFAYDSVRGKRKDRPASTHIEGDYNTVINNIASRMNVDPGRIEGVLEGQLPPAKRRGLLKPVTDFLNPARRNRGTKIKVDNFGEISPETIAEYPTDAELAEIDVKRNLDIPGATVEIRATDKDHSKSGWAGKIVGDRRFPRRLPMDLYPTVDAEALARFDQVRADVILEGLAQEDGTFKAKRIHILNVLEPAGGA